MRYLLYNSDDSFIDESNEYKGFFQYIKDNEESFIFDSVNNELIDSDGKDFFISKVN